MNSTRNPDSSELQDLRLDAENLMHEWRTQLETLATELEAAALAHPRLALLVAFGFGVVVGQLLARKQD